MPESSSRSPLGGVDLKRSILGALLKVAWPVALSTLLTQLMVLVDAFWIGRLQTTGALAAVGISGAVYAVLIAAAQLAIAPTMAYVARYTGEGNRALARGVLFHTLLISLVLSVTLAAVGVPLSLSILKLFGASADVAVQGAPYLRILFLILPFAFMGSVCFTALQATGDTLSPLLISVGANVVNLVLDPLLILGIAGFPRLGILGAGIATGIATFLNLGIALLIVNRKRLLSFARVRMKVVGNFLKIGFFAMIQLLTRPLTGLIMFYIVGLSGVIAQDAFTVGMRIIGLVFIFLTGTSIATQALVGQALGARSPQTARRIVGTAALWGSLLQVVLSLLIFTFASELVSLFSPGNVEVIAIGTRYLRIISPFLLASPAAMSLSGAQYGAGRTLGPAAAAVAANWLIKLPLAYLLSQTAGLGSDGVWIAIGVSVIVETLVTGGFYASGRWLKGTK